MTTAERVQAVVDYGFTDREARFLVLVMRHAGLCIKRQYAAFAGIVNGGDRCNALFTKLVRRGFALAVPCLHNRARLYHVHHKPFYHAIGEAHNPYLRGVSPRAVVERLTRLDAALISPELEWLTTRSEKVATLAAKVAARSSVPDSPALLKDVNLLPGTFPIGIDTTGRAVLVYVVTKPWTDDFRAFLVGHVPLLAATPTWTLRIVFPLPLKRVVFAYQRAVHEELEHRLDAQAINDLGWYFFHIRRRTDWSEYKGDCNAVKARFARCTTTFTGPRFRRLYRCWLTNREAALTPVPLAISEAFGAGRASLECVVLPHDYEPFSPVLRVDRGHRRYVSADDKEGEEAARGINRSLNRRLNRHQHRHEREIAPSIGTTSREQAL